uniref:Pre-mRNA splicing Prp18-interacting factor n=1 Tax=Tanacetum cinerariifolium TaxID=118510 RepID=A0A699GJI0_TANCI|nr:hypothetical protein [Tanacetum cinerariifolium]
MSSFYEFICYGCGGPSDTPLCYLCTCEQCGNILIDGACLKCNSGDGNSFVYDTNPKSFNELQSIFNPPPQPHYNIYLCQICESNSHYGYECSQRVPLVYEPKPSYNQSFGDNDYSHDSPGVTPLIDHHCCYNCRDLLDDFFANNALKLLYDNSSPCPPEEFISKYSDADIKSFSPSPIPVEDIDSLMQEIDLILTLYDSMPSNIEDDDYDSEKDILILEKLLSNDSLSLPENDSFHFDIPSSPLPPAKPQMMMKSS